MKRSTARHATTTTICVKYPWYKDRLRQLQKRELQEEVKQARPLSRKHFCLMMADTKTSVEQRAAIALAWGTASTPTEGREENALQRRERDAHQIRGNQRFGTGVNVAHPVAANKGPFRIGWYFNQKKKKKKEYIFKLSRRNFVKAMRSVHGWCFT